eukprot:363788-Prymnesium_polylepis.3
MTPPAYANRMRTAGQWGGAIEIALCAQLKGASINVYEPAANGQFRRISTFGESVAPKTVSLLYGGRVHYDSLVE